MKCGAKSIIIKKNLFHRKRLIFNSLNLENVVLTIKKIIITRRTSIKGIKFISGSSRRDFFLKPINIISFHHEEFQLISGLVAPCHLKDGQPWIDKNDKQSSLELQQQSLQPYYIKQPKFL